MVRNSQLNLWRRVPQEVSEEAVEKNPDRTEQCQQSRGSGRERGREFHDRGSGVGVAVVGSGHQCGEGLGALVARADNGDPDARAAIMELVAPMGAGIATLLSIFDAEQTILEGLFATVLRNFSVELHAAIDECRPARTGGPALLVPAQLGNSATLLGAAEGAIAAFLSQLDPYVERVRVADSVSR